MTTETLKDESAQTIRELREMMAAQSLELAKARERIMMLEDFVKLIFGAKDDAALRICREVAGLIF